MSKIKSLYILKGGIRVIFTDTELSTLSEAWAYANYVISKEDGKKPLEITVHRLGDYADINWIMQSKPFERIRRITGYLVGDKSRWNKAKDSEEKDRVKHLAIGMEDERTCTGLLSEE